MEEIKLGISVIICTHNGGSRLQKVFLHLEKQKDLDDIHWEIIVVDNASNDNTVQVVTSYIKKTNLPLKLTDENKKGLSNARRKGINISKYEYICFIDDDNWISPGFISSAYKIMSNHSDVGMCGGLGIADFESEAPVWYSDYQSAFAVGPQSETAGYIMKDAGYLYGAGCTLRRSAWNKLIINGFNYMLSGRKGTGLDSGEDMELCFALQLAGYKLWYDPEMKFEHFMPETRLTINHLKKLYKGFGKSDVVNDIYYSQFEHINNRKRVILENYFLCLLFNAYNTLKCMYYRLTNLSNKNELLSQLIYIRTKSRLIQHLKTIKDYNKMVLKIKSASWKSNKENKSSNTIVNYLKIPDYENHNYTSGS